jgi:hypothetical protein
MEHVMPDYDTKPDTKKASVAPPTRPRPPAPKSIAPPDKQSGVGAADLVNAPDVGTMTPDTATLSPITGGDTGVGWADHGAKCGPNPDGSSKGGTGCFMRPDQRQAVIIMLMARLDRVQNNYRDALSDLKVDELLKKDDDLNWMLSLVLDVAGAHILGVITNGLQLARTEGIARFSASLDVKVDASLAATAQKTLAAISDDDIKSWTKLGFDKAKKGAAGVAKDALNTSDTTKKAETLDYVNQLRNECDRAFDTLRLHTTADLNDVELMVVYHGMAPGNHRTELYYAALKDKIDRFHHSGVPQIGHKAASNQVGASIMRDQRVVWVKDIRGNRSLWYQAQDSTPRDPSVVAAGDPGSREAYPGYATKTFGPRHAEGLAQLERPVPKEFAPLALAKSEALWGATITVDDPMLQAMAHAGADPERMRQMALHANDPKPPPAPVPMKDPSSTLVPPPPDPFAAFHIPTTGKP